MRPRPHTAECAEVDTPVLGCPGTTRPGSGSSSRIPLSSCVCVTLTRAILQYWIINRVPACLRGRGEDGVQAEHLAAAQRSRGPVFLGTLRPPTVVRPTPLPSSPQGSVTDGDTPPLLGTTRCSYDKTDWLSSACQAAHPYLCLTQSHLGAPRSRRRSVRFLRGPCQPPPRLQDSGRHGPLSSCVPRSHWTPTDVTPGPASLTARTESCVEGA